jgi:hypothetical protein
LLSGLLSFQSLHLVPNASINSAPRLEEVVLRVVKVLFNKLMNTLASRTNHIAEMCMLISPGLHKLCLLRIKPYLNNIAGLISVRQHVFRLELLEDLFVSCFSRCPDDAVPASIEVFLSLVEVGIVTP